MPRLDQDLSGVTDDDMKPRGYRAFDAGEYVFHCTKSDYRPTNNKKGKVLELEWECIQPGKKGRVWEYLTLEHPNAETVRIAKARLKEIAIAVGHPNPNRVGASEELHRKPALLKLKKVRADRGGDDEGMKNEVLAYRRVQEGSYASPPPEPRREADRERSYGEPRRRDPFDDEAPPHTLDDAPPNQRRYEDDGSW